MNIKIATFAFCLITTGLMISGCKPETHEDRLRSILSAKQKELNSLVRMLSDDPALASISLDEIGHVRKDQTPISSDRLEEYRSLLRLIDVPEIRCVKP